MLWYQCVLTTIHYMQAERNRDKFQHISDHELSQRKKFVDEMQRSINGTR